MTCGGSNSLRRFEASLHDYLSCCTTRFGGIKPNIDIMALRGTLRTDGRKVGVGEGASLDYNEGMTKLACQQHKVS
jgi:hypothetical protein